MREIIGGKRRCGKTTSLIIKSSKENLIIVSPNACMARMTYDMSKSMGLDIPPPVTISDIGSLRGTKSDGILIDEIEMALEVLLGGLQVKGMSTSYNLKELPKIKE